MKYVKVKKYFYEMDATERKAVANKIAKMGVERDRVLPSPHRVAQLSNEQGLNIVDAFRLLSLISDIIYYKTET